MKKHSDDRSLRERDASKSADAWDRTDFPPPRLTRERKGALPERAKSTKEWFTWRWMGSFCDIFVVDHHCLVDLLQQLTDCWNFSRIEFLNPCRIHGHTDPAGLWVNAKGGFEQVVAMFRDFGIDARPSVLEDDVFHRSQEKFLQKRTKSASDLLASRGIAHPRWFGLAKGLDLVSNVIPFLFG